MRTRAGVSSVAASLGVLAIGWQIGAAALGVTAVPVVTTSSAVVTGGGTVRGSTITGGSSDPAATTSPVQALVTAPVAASGTFAGSVIDTRFGPVQVEVTVTSGSIVDVTALQLTNADGRSVQISNRAAPILRDEVLASQSANVANVSGATYTTQAYLGSLQSALDQAGI